MDVLVGGSGKGLFTWKLRARGSVTPVAKARLQEELCPGCLHTAQKLQSSPRRQTQAVYRASPLLEGAALSLHREPAGHARRARRLQPL